MQKVTINFTPHKDDTINNEHTISSDTLIKAIMTSVSKDVVDVVLSAMHSGKKVDLSFTINDDGSVGDFHMIADKIRGD